MGGGGFMDHAKNTNNDHRSRNKERKANYEKSHPSSTILKNEPTYTSFTVLKDDEIDAIHESVREKYATQNSQRTGVNCNYFNCHFYCVRHFFYRGYFQIVLWL